MHRSKISVFRAWEKEAQSGPVKPIHVSPSAYNDARTSTDLNYDLWRAERLNGDLPVIVDLHEANQDLSFKAEIDSLTLRAPGPITIAGRKIRYVDIASGKNIVVDGCSISTMRIGQNLSSIKISNCVIGNFEFAFSKANPVSIQSTTILNFISQVDPLIEGGSIILKNVFVPRNTKQGDFDLDALNKLRASLNDKHSRLAAAQLQSVALTHERKNDMLMSKVVSHVYEIGCDFGNSISRPSCWFLFSLTSLTFLAWGLSAVELGTNEAELVGWQKSLETNNLFRSVVYAGQTIFNPLGIFSSKSLLVAKNATLASLFAVLGLIGTTALVFLAISIRRRFKLEQ